MLSKQCQQLFGPSASPTDPLKWSSLRKELLFATIIFGSCATGSLGPLLVPTFVSLAAELEVSLANITLLNGSLVMALGISAYVCSCAARCFGKRPVYLFTTSLEVAACCWAASSKSYTSLLASRVFQGLGMGGFFALAGTASMNDIYSIEERGWRVGMWNFAVIVSVNLTPVISGNVISALSWHWAFWLQAIQFGVLLAAVILFFPETTFSREISNTQHTTADLKHCSDNNAFEIPDLDAEEKNGVPGVTSASTESIPIKSNNFLLLFIEPLAIVLDPIVIWASVMWSITFTWTILLGAVASQIFTAPPYKMSTVAVGNLVGIAPLIGSALGTLIGGLLCDLSSKLMAARNDGIYEPEFRLPVMLPATLAMAAGAFGLGAATQYGLSTVVCGVFMASVNFAVGMACTGIVAYTNDACGQRAGDCFGLAMVAKSAFAFGISFVLNDFVTKSGTLIFFSTFGAVSVVVMLTTIPLFLWGKKIRGWSDGRDLLRRRK